MKINVLTYITIFLIVIIINRLIFYIETNNVKVDLDENNNSIEEIYEKYPELFEFKDNKAIIKIPDLQKKKLDYEFDNLLDKDNNECLGYYIIIRENNKIKIDSSHVCDLID